NHGLGGLLEEGAHEKSPKCLGGNLGDFGEFCKGLGLTFFVTTNIIQPFRKHLAPKGGNQSGQVKSEWKGAAK
ncbi:hypothetical protein, partial [Neisseria meningitidis]|uniref:hypothetical protein n=1 Tax=Neisseria meningitidis TaxID=487 RepID=UPI00077C81A9